MTGTAGAVPVPEATVTASETNMQAPASPVAVTVYVPDEEISAKESELLLIDVAPFFQSKFTLGAGIASRTMVWPVQIVSGNSFKIFGS
jgi:hypothetical protein